MPYNQSVTPAEFHTPILLLVFNRPATTRQVFDRIREIRPAVLYIAADGPRVHKEGEEALCNEVRSIFEEVDWDCQVYTLFRADNLGCRKAVSGGISWFFEQEPEGIIIEDDVLPDSSFFPYCAELLERYRTDERVALVSGNNLISSKYGTSDSYFFSQQANIWGWATWKRVWDQYDGDLAGWDAWSRAGHLREKSAGTPFFEAYWKDQIGSVAAGKMDTWDFQFFYTCWRMNGLCVVPANNLTANLGFDQYATHTTGKMPDCVQTAVVRSLELPLRHPLEVRPALDADRMINSYVFQIGFFTILKWKLRRVPYIGQWLSDFRKLLRS